MGDNFSDTTDIKARSLSTVADSGLANRAGEPQEKAVSVNSLCTAPVESQGTLVGQRCVVGPTDAYGRQENTAWRW